MVTAPFILYFIIKSYQDLTTCYLAIPKIKYFFFPDNPLKVVQMTCLGKTWGQMLFLDFETWPLAVGTQFGRIAMTSEALDFCMEDDLTVNHICYSSARSKSSMCEMNLKQD